jgi:uncharacterized membrane protein YbhN (UPF0104 family)
MSRGPTPGAARPLGRRLWRLAAALALLAAVLWWVEPGRVWAELQRADGGWLAAGLLSSAAANALSAWRWRAAVRWLGFEVPLRWALPVYFRGVAANVVLPGAVLGGDMLRAWSLHRRGVPALEASVSVVLDRLSGLWGLGLLGCLALVIGSVSGQGGPLTRALHALGQPGLLPVVGAAAAALAAGMALLPYGVLRISTSAGARWALLQRPAWRWWRQLAMHAPGRHWGQQLVGSLAVQAASVTTLAAGLHALGAPLPWTSVAVAAVPIFVLATLPVSFGGWGTREAAALAVLVPMGIDAPTAVAASVLYGLAPVTQAPLALLPSGDRDGHADAPAYDGR